MIEGRCQNTKESLFRECGRVATKRIRPEAPIFICDECLKDSNTELVQEYEDQQLSLW
jgi:hypothetical protein